MAAFAAIMLLASTQVERPETPDGADRHDLALWPGLATDLEESALDGSDELDESEGVVSSLPASSPSKKSPGLSLDLLQFRR
jgi:hypothetical protein